MFDLVSERTCNLSGKLAGQARLRVRILLILLVSFLETINFDLIHCACCYAMFIHQFDILMDSMCMVDSSLVFLLASCN